MKDNVAMSALNNNLSDQGIEIEEMGKGGDYNLPQDGIMQTRTPYSTAIQVVKPRNLNLVEQRCIQEAARAGDEFYYSWSQGGSIVEGNTVGAALMMVRNWGNCAIDVKVSETPSGYVFYGAFIDLETGFNLVRPYKMSKQSPKNKQGREIYSGERGRDIIFQIGASKAIRNVTLNALPKWLSEKVREVAKTNVIGQVETMGKEKAIGKLIKRAESLKIAWDRIESNYGKKESWDTDKIVAVMGAIRSVEDGIESMDEVFAEKTPVHGEPDFRDKKTSAKKQEAEVINETDWELPVSIVAAIYGLYDKDSSSQELVKKINEFRKENKARLECFSGEDETLIKNSLEDVEKKALGKKDAKN
jgi:hypothetical protein